MAARNPFLCLGLLAMALASVSCTGEVTGLEDGGSSADIGAQPGPDASALDASPAPADASQNPPDAAPVPLDASQNPPDAAPVPLDASQNPPDAAPTAPDAGRPDSGLPPLDAGSHGDASIAPLTIISRMSGVHAFASNDLDGTMGDFGANRGRDAVYGGWGHYWRAPYPAWLAYDLSAVAAARRGSVLVAWYNESYGYNSASSTPTPASYSEPGAYVLEGNAAAGSASGAPANGWVSLGVDISGNTLHSRTHLVNLAGYNWIRFRASAGAVNNQTGNVDCEIKLEVFDASQGNTDSFAFLGDSITAGGMGHDETGDMNLAQRINATVSAAYPPTENAGIPFDMAIKDGAGRLAVLLGASQARYIGIAYGMNDAGGGMPTNYDFYNAYAALVDTVLGAGRIPIVPTISWTANEPWHTAIGDPDTGPQYCLNKQLAKLKADYRAQGKTVIDGPDLWHFFEANPTLIGTGDIHPTTPDGYVAYRNQWAAAIIANVYGH